MEPLEAVICLRIAPQAACLTFTPVSRYCYEGGADPGGGKEKTTAKALCVMSPTTAMASPAAAVKARPRKTIDKAAARASHDSDDEEWLPQPAAKPSRPKVRADAVVTGGMSIKSGFVLARAQLAANSSTGVVAAQERQTAMVGKGKYREEEKVAQELPVGSLATNEMPRRKDFAGAEQQHQKKRWLLCGLKPLWSSGLLGRDRGRRRAAGACGAPARERPRAQHEARRAPAERRPPRPGGLQL